MWRRGADSDGYVANFVESEQIIQLNGSTASFVQVTLQNNIKEWFEFPSKFLLTRTKSHQTGIGSLYTPLTISQSPRKGLNLHQVQSKCKKIHV